MAEHKEHSSDQSAPEHSGHEIRREIFELVKMVLLFLVMFWGLKTFVIEGYEVNGNSMLPAYRDGDRILVFKLPHQLSRWPGLHWLDPIDPGDVVVFDSETEASKRFIKRVIARGPKAPAGKTVEADQHSDKEWFVHVLFDKGRVYVNNHPVDEAGYLTPVEAHSPDRDEQYLKNNEYYVLGDHRSVSRDSRSFGPIDDQQIIGTALLRFWPLSRFSVLW
jgi:signal peptidase I